MGDNEVKYIILALALFGCENQFNSTETSQGIELPCERYQGTYKHTTISCGDYYDETVILCDENNNYDRGNNCVNPSDVLDIVRENRPCSRCGCVVSNICSE